MTIQKEKNRRLIFNYQYRSQNPIFRSKKIDVQR